MDERISDERLEQMLNPDKVRVFSHNEICNVLRELQQRRAADKCATYGHLDDCSEGYATGVDPHTGEVLTAPCDCGFDQLPAWLRGGQ